uniref:DUF5641 domain-containing protein n=1 Tax=Anopheles epiroticus TaxID=199890 RepID=A0A182PWX4_9DIPT
MDDLIAGSDSIDGAIQLRKELSTLVQRGGFTFRKWCSNSLSVLADLPPNLLGTKSALRFDTKETITTLGISWEPESDAFCFNISNGMQSEPETKRSILSSIAQLFDPLGIISPVTVTAKIIMQSLWRLKLNWDETVPDGIQKKWRQFRTQLPELQNFHYLKQLTVMHRVSRQPKQLAVGDLVIIKDEQLPAVQWPLARVIEIHPGPDGLARVATLRTSTTTVKRAI